jgi:hypothetical protein
MNKQKFFKITNKDENHHGFQYKDGLNLLEGQFNMDTIDPCGAGGLYFTTLDNIEAFYNLGVWLREVEQPEENDYYRVVNINDCGVHKWRSNMLVLKNKYPLYDISTLEKFNLPVNEKYILGAITNGSLELLDYLYKNNENVFMYTYMNCRVGFLYHIAAQTGNIQKLDWLYGRGCLLDASLITNFASDKTILQWVIDHNCPAPGYMIGIPQDIKDMLCVYSKIEFYDTVDEYHKELYAKYASEEKTNKIIKCLVTLGVAAAAAFSILRFLRK